MIAPTRTGATVGECLPPFEKRFSQVDLMAYGAATWDWHRLHHDLEYARSMNLPGTVVDGQAFGALFARAAMDWGGPKAFVARLSFRMKSMAFAGDSLVGSDAVLSVAPDGTGVRVTLAQRLMNGERLTAEATTELHLPKA